MHKKVMVIDDTEVDRYVAELVIKKYHFSEEVIACEGVQEALDYLLLNEEKVAELPEVIFLDIRMPELDGFDFLERFGHLPESLRKKIIIVMLSSSLDEEDHERALKSPYVHQFINKPLLKEELISIDVSTQQDSSQS